MLLTDALSILKQVSSKFGGLFTSVYMNEINLEINNNDSKVLLYWWNMSFHLSPNHDFITLGSSLYGHSLAYKGKLQKGNANLKQKHK